MLELIRNQNLWSLFMKLSQSNFNLRLPDCYLVRSYLIATVKIPVLRLFLVPIQYFNPNFVIHAKSKTDAKQLTLQRLTSCRFNEILGRKVRISCTTEVKVPVLSLPMCLLMV